MHDCVSESTVNINGRIDFNRLSASSSLSLAVMVDTLERRFVSTCHMIPPRCRGS